MFYRHITDWDDAYANGPNIPGGDRWPAAWVEPANAFRETLGSAGCAELDLAYGDAPRNTLDLFLPEGKPAGLVVFIHGGYWKQLDKSFWSHLARGSVERGYAVAMPSYTLCPDTSIAGITAEIGRAIELAAEKIAGPIHITGHSAGGHLTGRMVCADSPLSQKTRERVTHAVPISGLFDLRPLMRLEMNEVLNVTEALALSESPALLEPLPGTRLTCWVGGGERAEFLRQNALLANIWTGLGAATTVVEEPDRHHFNVIDGLADPHSPLVECLLTV